MPSVTSRGTGSPVGLLSTHLDGPHSSTWPSRTSCPTLSSLGAPAITTTSTSRPSACTLAVATPSASTVPLAVSTRSLVGRSGLLTDDGGHTCLLAPVSTTHPVSLHAVVVAARARAFLLPLAFRFLSCRRVSSATPLVAASPSFPRLCTARTRARRIATLVAAQRPVAVTGVAAGGVRVAPPPAGPGQATAAVGAGAAGRGRARRLCVRATTRPEPGVGQGE